MEETSNHRVVVVVVVVGVNESVLTLQRCVCKLELI